MKLTKEQIRELINRPFDENAPETEEDGYRAGALRIARYKHQSAQSLKQTEARDFTPSDKPKTDK